MRVNHNILLVTNDHVATLTSMADNTITVSALDRSHVKVNLTEGVERDLSLLAVSSGNDFEHSSNKNDLGFFSDVEILHSPGLRAVAGFTSFIMILFIMSYWNSTGCHLPIPPRPPKRSKPHPFAPACASQAALLLLCSWRYRS